MMCHVSASESLWLAGTHTSQVGQVSGRDTGRLGHVVPVASGCQVFRVDMPLAVAR